MREAMWIVIANSSTARIFSKKKGNHKLNLVMSFEHPESRKKVRELISDGAGRYRSRGDMVHGAFSPHTNPKKVEADYFANKVAKFLEHERRANHFKQLLFVMPANFEGKINRHVSNQLRQQITDIIHKDYHEATTKQLEELLK